MSVFREKRTTIELGVFSHQQAGEKCAFYDTNEHKSLEQSSPHDTTHFLQPWPSQGSDDRGGHDGDEGV